MKKSMSMALTVIISFSLTACTSRNNANTTRNNSNNQGSYTRNNVSTAKYKDGVYTGYGDKTSNGNEMAVVTVRGGRIIDVNLTSVDTQGRNKYGNGANTDNTGNTAGTSAGAGTNIGGTANRAGGTGTGYGAIGGPAGAGYGTVGSNSYGTTDRTGVTGTPSGGTGITGNNLGGSLTGTALDTYYQVRNSLASNMIQYQTHNVAAPNTDGTMTNSVKNWQLAVKRALDKAAK